MRAHRREMAALPMRPLGPPLVRRVPRHLDRGRSLGPPFAPEIPPAHVSSTISWGQKASLHRGPTESWEPRATSPPAWRIRGLRAGPYALAGNAWRRPEAPSPPRSQPATTGLAPLFSPDGLRLLCRGGPAPPHDGRLPCRGWAWQPTEPAPLLSPSGS